MKTWTSEDETIIEGQSSWGHVNNLWIWTFDRKGKEFAKIRCSWHKRIALNNGTEMTFLIMTVWDVNGLDGCLECVKQNHKIVLRIPSVDEYPYTKKTRKNGRKYSKKWHDVSCPWLRVKLRNLVVWTEDGDMIMFQPGEQVGPEPGIFVPSSQEGARWNNCWGPWTTVNPVHTQFSNLGRLSWQKRDKVIAYLSFPPFVIKKEKKMVCFSTYFQPWLQMMKCATDEGQGHRELEDKG